MAKRLLGKSIEQIRIDLQKVIDNVTLIAGTEAVKHFQQGFRNQGFTDAGFTGWKPREKDKAPGRAMHGNVMPIVSGYDTVIHAGAYTSYFSYHYKNPLAVMYKLYQGGGDCSRAGFRFKNDIPTLPAATATDYAHNGYDEGHLCDAADMAYDCTLDESTFRFYNCVPQTPSLNRGVWKVWESIIRKESQTDSLLIEAGSIFKADSGQTETVIGDSVYVPVQCYKVVISLTTGFVMHAILCDNLPAANCKEIDYSLLQLKLNK